MYNELKDIPGFENWKVIKQVEKGWSADAKFYIEDLEGKKFLLRISDVENYDTKHYDAKQKEFQFIRKCNTLSFAMSQAIDFGCCNDYQNVYMLLTWVEGESLDNVLRDMSEEQQYKLGLQAGAILKSIHSLKVKPEENVIAANKKEKIVTKLALYEKSGNRVEDDQIAIDYVKANLDKINSLPPVYIHNDFHVGNLILTPSGSVGVIDFNRWEYGDPYEEFYKIQSFDVEVSIPFSVGQIHGYFGGEPSIDFWNVNAVYVAYTSLNSIVWAEKFGEDDIKGMQKRCLAAFEDYDKFKTVIPKWYKENTVKYRNVV